jgi:hypothetical protein
MGSAAFWSWLANIFFMVSFYHFSRHLYRKVLASTALGLAISGYFIHELPANEAGKMVGVEVSSGFYCWIFGIALNLLFIFRNKDPLPEDK